MKSQIISSLANQTYLSTLHKNLATIAESLTNLDSLFSYHPSTELSSNIKETIAIEVATWYSEYCTNHPSDCKLDERRQRNYPFAVLLPVVIDIITTKNVTTIDSPPPPHPPSPLEDPLHSITYPKWQGSFNNTFQDNTCPVDNILAILSLNQSTILNALSIKGVKPANTKFHQILSLLENHDFDELRDYIARRIGLQVNYDSTGLYKSYDFYGSEATIINFIRSEDLCNYQYISTFKCHHCTKSFNTKSMLGTIGIVVTNLESCLSRNLNPNKCKSCGSTTAVFERLSGKSESVPTLLTIEIGHLPELKNLTISDIDRQINISHEHLTLHYQLAGFSIFFQNHFYSMLWNNGQFHKYDDLRTPATETWDCNSFYGTVNNVFYLLHSFD